MKRYHNLYENIYNVNNIIACFNEVCKNTNIRKRKKNLKVINVFIYIEYIMI